MKKILSIALMLMLALSLTTVAVGAEESLPSEGPNMDLLNGKSCVLLMPTLGDSFLVTIGENVTAIADEYGMKVDVYGADGDLTTQIQQMENAVSMGADVIILVPLNVDAFEASVASAREKGVKVVLCSDDPAWDADILWLSVAEVIGEMVGEMAIEWADQALPDAGPGDIKFCWLTTSLDRPDAERRCMAMYDKLMSDERFEMVFRKDDILDAPAAITAMQECLTLNKDINVVITYADTQGIGCNSAIMADSSLDYSKIGIFSGSDTAESRQLVDESADNKSVLRGLVTFGEGDSFFRGYVECAAACFDENYPTDYALFQYQGTYNSIGYEASFDPTEYAKTYQNNGHPDGYTFE